MKQEYSLKQDKQTGAGFAGFAKAYYDFNMPAVSNVFTVSQQFIEMIYENAKTDTITFEHGSDNTHLIYDGKILLAKIHGDKLTGLWMPTLVDHNSKTAFLQSTGVEFVVSAGFPNMVHGGDNFMKYAYELKYLCIQKMRDMGQDSLFYSQMEGLCMPSVRKFGKNTLYDNKKMTRFNAKNLRELENNVLFSNTILDSEDDKVYVPKLTRVGRGCAEVFYALRNKNLSR